MSVAKLRNAGYNVDTGVGLGFDKIQKSQSSIDKSHNTFSSSNLLNLSNKKLNEAEEKLVHSLRRPTAGSLNLLKHLEREHNLDDLEKSDCCTSGSDSLRSKDAKLNRSESNATFANFFASVSKKPQKTSDYQSNQIKGYVDLGPISSTMDDLDSARQRAVDVVKSLGGIRTMQSRDVLKKKTSLVFDLETNRDKVM